MVDIMAVVAVSLDALCLAHCMHAHAENVCLKQIATSTHQSPFHAYTVHGVTCVIPHADQPCDATVCVSADPTVIAKHQPMIWGTDRIQSGYAAITSRPSYAKPSYVLTFNEPNYAFGGGTPTNVVDPVTAANLWPQLIAQYDPLGIQLIAPSAIDCAGDGNCKNTGTAVGWLTTFRDVKPPPPPLLLIGPC